MKTGIIGALFAVLLSGCGTASAPEGFLLDPGWERVTAEVRTTADFDVASRVIRPSPEAQERFAEAGKRDRAWYAPTGERYDALLVTPEGTAYGRLGDAPARGEPTGPSRGELAEAAAQLEKYAHVQQEERIWTDTSIDNRSRIWSSSSLTSFPSNVIGTLTASGGLQSGGCTGAKVGPRHVLTTAHCVLQEDGTLRTSGFFNPGQSSTQALNGSIPWSGVFLRDWRISRDYDYALLYLQNTAAVASTGYMGVGYWNSASSYTGRSATLRGYPCGADRACGEPTYQRCAASPEADKTCNGWMYSHTATLDGEAMSGNRLNIDNDGSSGQSGSPIYGAVSGSDGWIFAVYWGSNSGANQGVRFRSSMWNDICSWIAAYPSAYVAHPSCN